MTGFGVSIRVLLTGFAGIFAATVSILAAAGDPLVPKTAQLGPRPFYLVDQLAESKLKDALSECAVKQRQYIASDFSIGHRGSAMQFPEHTRESYISAAQMGAGIIECDVTFTRDLALVCRHDQCDLHTTTDILATPLASKCAQPFKPAGTNPVTGEYEPATARCCTSDITLAEFKTLKGKMDAANSAATTVQEYLDGTTGWRTDLYATGGTLLTHAESIDLIRKAGRKFIPELKTPRVPMPFNGFSQEDYAAKMIEEYIAAGVDPTDVWPQSFLYDDVRFWLARYPDFGKQAVFLDGRYDPTIPLPDFVDRVANGLNVIAPPMQILLTVQGDTIVPSGYAERARKAGLDIISWTTERSGRVDEEIIPGKGAFYYDTTVSALKTDGDILRQIDVLAQDVRILGLFSDWPATTTFYANCKAIPGNKAKRDNEKVREELRQGKE